jgi:arylsulfatase A-like enzyme
LLRDEEVVGVDPNQASLTDYYLEDAVQFIRDNREGPFFLYFAHMYVHLPLYAPYRFLQQAQNGPYGAAVEHIDETTGVLLDTLSELGIDENTLVTFTSDNGSNGRNGGSNIPLRGNKGSTWEGGMREPCVMRWPGHIPAGTTCSELCTAMDMLPTLGNLAHAEMPEDRSIDGKDIQALIFGEEGASSPYEAFFYYGQNNLRAVRVGKWKLHLEDGMLVDLDADIGETTDISRHHPDVVSELEAQVEQCRRDLGDAIQGVEGVGCRPAGWVEDPKFLTPHKFNPYVEAAYD